MSFKCPKCQQYALSITSCIELPPDHHSDEIALQVVQCPACRFIGVAVFEESRRGSFESDAWEHVGYQITAVSLSDIVDLIRHCPRPHDSQCDCSSHKALAALDPYGRWQGLHRFKLFTSFPMELRHRSL